MSQTTNITTTILSTFLYILKKCFMFLFYTFFSIGLAGGLLFAVAVIMYGFMLCYSTQDFTIICAYSIFFVVLLGFTVFLIIYEVIRNVRLSKINQKRAKNQHASYTSGYPYRTEPFGSASKGYSRNYDAENDAYFAPENPYIYPKGPIY